MNRFASALGVLALLSLAGCGGLGGGPRGPRVALEANPSAVIAAELGFARMAREQGQWTAFAEYAADSGVMFVPEQVNARTWLKGRADPPESVAWQPHQVWSSCDGSLAVTRGAWQRPDGSQGRFTTIWQRQERGDYRWVLDMGEALAEPLAEPEMIAATVADCDTGNARPARPGADGGEPGPQRPDMARDGTLHWTLAGNGPDGYLLTVTLRKDGDMREILTSRSAP